MISLFPSPYRTTVHPRHDNENTGVNRCFLLPAKALRSKGTASYAVTCSGLPERESFGSEGGIRTHDQWITVPLTGLCHHPCGCRGLRAGAASPTPFQDSLYTFPPSRKALRRDLARRWSDRRPPNSPGLFTPLSGDVLPRVDLRMTVRADERALAQSLSDFLPRAGDSVRGNAEILACRIEVMERERGFAFRVTAPLAFSSSICDRHLLETLASMVDEELSLA